MYCGSCFRDNALAAELRRQGHDITLMPVYTPTRTDEANASDQAHVLFGGINVYLQQRSALFRHLPAAVGGLLDRPSVIRALSGGAVATSPALLGELTLSMLRGRSGVLRKEFDKLAAWIRHEPVPDVINLPNSMLVAMAGPLKEATGRPIACTLQGEELFLEGLLPPYHDEALRLIREQVPAVDRFIAVSEYAAAHMAAYLAIPAAKISVVPLGIAFTGYADRPRAIGATETIGYFARVAPEKGLHLLAEAYAILHRRLGAKTPALAAAGYMAASEAPYLESVRRTLSEAGCADRFSYHGELDRAGKIRFLSSLDVLSVPATYDEPKGMFLLEAMAAGVPVVQPRRGAFTEIVERTGGGCLVEPDNAAALAEGLERLVTDRALASDLGHRAFEGVRARHRIEQSAARVLAVYAEMVA